MVNAGLSARKEVSVKRAVVTMGTVAEKGGMIVKKQLLTWLQLILTLALDGQVKLSKKTVVTNGYFQEFPSFYRFRNLTF